MKRIVLIVLLATIGLCQAAEEQKKSTGDLVQANQQEIFERLSSLSSMSMESYNKYHKALRRLVRKNPILREPRIDAEKSVILACLSNCPGLFFNEDARQNIQNLLDAGVPIDQANRKGRTALHSAVTDSLIGNMGTCACTRILLGSKADPTKQDDQGNSPVALAVKRGLPGLTDFSDHPKVFNQPIFIDGQWKSYASVINEPTDYRDTQRYLQGQLAQAPVTSLELSEALRNPKTQLTQDFLNRCSCAMLEHMSPLFSNSKKKGPMIRAAIKHRKEQCGE